MTTEHIQDKQLMSNAWTVQLMVKQTSYTRITDKMDFDSMQNVLVPAT